MSVLSDPQRASLAITAGKNVSVRLKIKLTPTGLLTTAVLVSGILLSTRALVGTAIRESRR